MHPLAGRRGLPATDFGDDHLVVGAPHMGVRGFTQPLDQFHDPGGCEVAFGGGRQVLWTPMVTAALGLRGPAGRTNGATESPAIRAVPSSTLSTAAGKKFIAGEPMNPATNRSAGE